jgi:hypothetical protein
MTQQLQLGNVAPRIWTSRNMASGFGAARVALILRVRDVHGNVLHLRLRHDTIGISDEAEYIAEMNAAGV